VSGRHAEPAVTDVVVIGAGPAGIAVAARIAESGRRVILLDESPQVGGQIWRHRNLGALPNVARKWMSRLARSGVTVLTGSAVVDVNEVVALQRFVVTAERDGAPYFLSAESVVLATGARERFLPFPGWTLPGVVGIGGAQALVKSGLSFARKRVVISGTGPLLLPVAASLARDGARIALVAEQAPRGAVVRFASSLWREPGVFVKAVRYRAGFLFTPYRTGTWVVSARGEGRLEEVTLTNGHSTRTIACDVLCSAYGLVPNTQLARLLECEIARGAVVVDGRHQTTRARVYSVGETTGIGGVELALVEGEIAALCIIGREGDVKRLHRRRSALRKLAGFMDVAFAPRAELRSVATPETIVCRCEDVALGAIDPGWTVRQAKLYSRAGMGPCQGRVCGAAFEFMFGWPADVVRTPVEPALLSTLLADPGEISLESLHQGADQ
jgi:NADPH-dependent 2,4-dienoyl-CoA reductase/sulfur reductase-like enzyme